MEILKTPWKVVLLELVAQSKKSIKITSPFIKDDICSEVLSAKKSHSKFEFITAINLNNIYSGSLDIDAVERIINHKGIVRHYQKLHSKIYLFDDSKVIITSGNLTRGGLINNFEYGIFSDDERLVSMVSADFNSISKSEKTGTITSADIVTVNKLLSHIPEIEAKKLPKFKIENPLKTKDIIEIPQAAVYESLKGWKLHVFKSLNNLSGTEFTLKDIYAFEKSLSQLYPDNYNVKDKIRQQLQKLRDIGLIEFKRNGRYKRLWH